jgi:hypothetical protein
MLWPLINSTMSTSTFIVEQLIFNNIIKYMTWIKFIEGTHGNHVIIHKIFNKIFNKPKKKVLVLTTIGAMASGLLLATRIVHTWYKTPICGYSYTLIEPNNTLQELRLIDVFIIDEMSLLTNIMLSCIYTKKKKQCPKPWFIFIYNSITCWGFNTITIDLSPLDQWWQSCVWRVSHQKIINMKLRPTLFFAIICTLCLWFKY